MLAKSAHENGKQFGINLSAIFIVQIYQKELLELIKYADFVFGNEDETAAWAKVNGLPFESLKEVNQAIAKLPKMNESTPRVVFTT